MRYIDTNIILRFLVEPEENLPEGLLTFFEKLEKGELKVKCLDIVFFQVIFVLKSFYKVEKEKIIEVMRKILSLNGLYIKNKKIMERTLDLWETHSDDIIDCYIVANMENDDEKELYSFDKKIKKFGIKVICDFKF